MHPRYEHYYFTPEQPSKVLFYRLCDLYSKVSATVQFSPYWFPPKYPRAVVRGGDDQMRSEFPVS